MKKSTVLTLVALCLALVCAPAMAGGIPGPWTSYEPPDINDSPEEYLDGSPQGLNYPCEIYELHLEKTGDNTFQFTLITNWKLTRDSSGIGGDGRAPAISGGWGNIPAGDLYIRVRSRDTMHSDLALYGLAMETRYDDPDDPLDAWWSNNRVKTILGGTHEAATVTAGSLYADADGGG